MIKFWYKYVKYKQWTKEFFIDAKTSVTFTGDGLHILGQCSVLTVFDFVYLFACLFIVRRAIFQLSGGCHHYSDSPPHLDLCLALMLLAVRVPLHASPAKTRDLRF
jgi:hypothetical protein